MGCDMEPKVNQNLENKLWQLFNQIRRYSTPVESSLLWLLAVAVLAKQSREKFQQLIKLNSEKKLVYVIDNSYCKLSNHQFDIDSLEPILNFIKEVKDFSLLADEILGLLSGSFMKDLDHGFSSQIISTFIKKYVDKENLISVYDGAAGYCSVSSQITAENFYLMDINQGTKAFGQGIMLLKDKKIDYECGDTLSKTIKSKNADLVVCEPPWGLRLDAKKTEVIKGVSYLLSKELETPPTSASDSLWIQNSLYHLSEHGKAFVILPHGWLFRGGYDALLRKLMLDLDVIEAIVGLPARIMKTTVIPLVILILNKNKINKKTVHIVDASDMGTVDKRQVNLSATEIQSLVDMAQGINTNEQHYRAIPSTQIKANDYNLAINRYIENKKIFSPYSINDEMGKLENVFKKSEASQQKLFKLLAEELGN